MAVRKTAVKPTAAKPELASKPESELASTLGSTPESKIESDLGAKPKSKAKSKGEPKAKSKREKIEERFQSEILYEAEFLKHTIAELETRQDLRRALAKKRSDEQFRPFE